jgi:hypothetical protein
VEQAAPNFRTFYIYYILFVYGYRKTNGKMTSVLLIAKSVVGSGRGLT